MMTCLTPSCIGIGKINQDTYSQLPRTFSYGEVDRQVNKYFQYLMIKNIKNSMYKEQLLFILIQKHFTEQNFHKSVFVREDKSILQKRG